jgi:gliding motility-associated-like protein
MKRFLPFLLLFTGFHAFSQFTCTVTPADAIMCPGLTIRFEASVDDTGTYTYQWTKNGSILADSVRTLLVIQNLSITDSGTYRCIATRETVSVTSNAAHLKVLEKLNIDTLYRYNELGCPESPQNPNPCKGQFKTHVSGGTPPYDYHWGGGHSQDTIVFGLCPGYYRLIVYDSDSSHCNSSRYFVDVLRLPKIEFTMDPTDTVYLTNPTLTVSFPDTSEKHLTNWEWDFGDGSKVPNINPAQHAYYKTGNYLVTLNFTDNNGCDTTISDSIIVRTANLQIPSVFTPNGDGYNDTFMILIKDAGRDKEFSEAYLGNEMLIFDRWGKKVYSKTNYKSGDWDGGRNPDGVYYYILKLQGYYGNEVYKGSIMIIASGFK